MNPQSGEEKNRAVFFDRDGTLIVDHGYICSFSQVEVFPDAIEAVRRINELGYKVIIITNQSSIARGICTENQVNLLHEKLVKYFKKQGALIDHIYYCPFHEAGAVEEYTKKHPCRKPEPGMIREAAREHNIDLSRSYVVGDSFCDVAAAHNAGCKGILVMSGKDPWGSRKKLEENKINPFRIADNVLSAVNEIISAEE